MRFETQISAIMLGNQLQRLSKIMASNLNRLASGNRLTGAKDDMASISQAAGLTAQIRGFNQIVRNINDAIAAFNIADSAIQFQNDIVLKMRELAQRSSNGTMSKVERALLNTEFFNLLRDYENIASSTSFNGHALLNGATENLKLQVGTKSKEVLNLSFAPTNAGRIFTHLAGSGTFDAATTYALSSGLATRILTVDFNNDGLNDLVHADGPNFQVRLGVGEGRFSAAQVIASSNSSRWFDVADVNGDGNLDIVTVNTTGPGSLQVFYGSGTGSFNTSQTFAIGVGDDGVRDVRIADLNGDSAADIVVTYRTIDTVGIYLNNGNGTFQSAITYATGDEPRSVDIADITGDGKVDMIVANKDSNTLSFFRGNGDGTFQTGITYATSSDPYDPHLVDLNKDGILDMLLGFDDSPGLSVMIGNGDGTFKTPTVLSTADAQYIGVGDINNDGNLDIAFESGTNIIVRMGNGDGTFQNPITLSNAYRNDIHGVNFGDLNNDGVLDLMIGDETTNEISLMRAHTLTQSALHILSIETQETAEEALKILDTALDNLLSARSHVGRQKSQLEFAAAHSLRTAESLSAARSVLTETDFVLEIAELVKNQILSDINISILSQANLNQKLVLELLKK